MITCYDSNDPECVRRVYELRNKGLLISTTVKNGDELPVEALAKFVDYAYELFDYNTHGSVWAITNVLTGIDVNHSAAWQEMISGHDGQRFFIGFEGVAKLMGKRSGSNEPGSLGSAACKVDGD